MIVADDRYKGMNAGVALLLERMKTNPEEFGVRDGKWTSLMNNHIMHLEKKDRDALNEGMDKLMQQRFTEQVMQELIYPNKPSDWELANVMTTQHSMSVNKLQATISALGSSSTTVNTVATPIAGVTQTI